PMPSRRNRCASISPAGPAPTIPTCVCISKEAFRCVPYELTNHPSCSSRQAYSLPPPEKGPLAGGGGAWGTALPMSALNRNNVWNERDPTNRAHQSARGARFRSEGFRVSSRDEPSQAGSDGANVPARADRLGGRRRRRSRDGEIRRVRRDPA